MYKSIGMLWMLMAVSANAADSVIPDYKANYTFTNSNVSMEGVRELQTFVDGKRSLSFNARFPLGKINIGSEFHEVQGIIATDLYTVSAKWTLIKQERTLIFNRQFVECA